MAICVFALLFLLPCGAQESRADRFSALPAEYGEMLQSLPEALRDSTPEAVLSADSEEVADALAHFLTPATLFSYLLELLTADLSLPLHVLVGVCGILLLRAVINGMALGLGGTLSDDFGLLCRLVFCLFLVGQARDTLTQMHTYFSALRQLTSAYIPLMGSLYLSGGNTATAAVNQSTLVFADALVSVLGGKSVEVMVSFCLALTMVGVLDGSLGARMLQISGKIKAWYTTALALVMLLTSGILAAQTTLAAKADSMLFKTVRFAVSSQIPLVGGGVAEMMRSAASGVTWLRSVVGIGGVMLLGILLLPLLFRVLLCRWVCTFGADVAAWLGCEEERQLLGEIGNLYGYLIAVAALSGMTFFFSLIFFLQCATAFS